MPQPSDLASTLFSKKWQPVPSVLLNSLHPRHFLTLDQNFLHSHFSVPTCYMHNRQTSNYRDDDFDYDDDNNEFICKAFITTVQTIWKFRSVTPVQNLLNLHKFMPIKIIWMNTRKRNLKKIMNLIKELKNVKEGTKKQINEIKRKVLRRMNVWVLPTETQI